MAGTTGPWRRLIGSTIIPPQARAWLQSNPWFDLSVANLIFINLAMIVVAIVEHWEIGTIIWIYWFQSVIIGFYQFLRIVSLKDFSTSGLLVNDRPVPASKKTQWALGFFFLAHYGFFHLVYLIFLLLEVPLATGVWSLVLYGAGVFFLNHGLSFVLNYRRDTTRQQNLGRIIAIPYARIIPMHIAIVFSFLFLQTFGFVPFMLLKTAADVLMHVAEHA